MDSQRVEKTHSRTMFNAVITTLQKVTDMNLSDADRITLNRELSKCLNKSRKKQNEKIGNVNYGRRYTSEEDLQIIHCLNNRQNLNDLCVNLGRSETGFKEHVQKILFENFDLDTDLPINFEYILPRHIR